MTFFSLFQQAGEYAQNQNMLQGDDEGLGGAWTPEEISKKMDPPKNLKTPENHSMEGKSQEADHLKILPPKKFPFAANIYSTLETKGILDQKVCTQNNLLNNQIMMKFSEGNSTESKGSLHTFWHKKCE